MTGDLHKRCSYHWDRCFFNHGLFFVTFCGCTLVGFAHSFPWLCVFSQWRIWSVRSLLARGFSLAVRLLFTKKDALCFFSNGLLQIECLRDVLIEASADESMKISGDSVSMVSRLRQDAVLPNSVSSCPRLDQCAHCPSKQISILHWVFS